MAYIAAVNPAILVEAGMPFDAALTSTCFGAAFSLLMSDFFDTMGGVVAVGRPGGFVSRFEHAFPAFLIVAGIPFTYSITDGIGLGFIAYVIVMVVLGRVREVKPLMWVASLAFLLMFIVQ